MNRARLAELAAARELARRPISDPPPKTLPLDERATVLLEYQVALNDSRTMLTELINTEPGTARARELANKLAHAVGVVVADAEFLGRSK